MRELKRRLLLEVAGNYHHKIHASLHRPPIAVWREHMGDTSLRLTGSGSGSGFSPRNGGSCVCDDIHLFGIRYWSPALSQDVGCGEQRLIVRYDRRDLSTVFVRRTNGHFVEACYRSLGRPPISLWEWNAAVRQLNAKGRRKLDEAMILSSVMEQRSIEDDARRLTARSRQNRKRRPVSHQDATGARASELVFRHHANSSPRSRPTACICAATV